MEVEVEVRWSGGDGPRFWDAACGASFWVFLSTLRTELHFLLTEHRNGIIIAQEIVAGGIFVIQMHQDTARVSKHHQHFGQKETLSIIWDLEEN